MRSALAEASTVYRGGGGPQTARALPCWRTRPGSPEVGPGSPLADDRQGSAGRFMLNALPVNGVVALRLPEPKDA